MFNTQKLAVFGNGLTAFDPGCDMVGFQEAGKNTIYIGAEAVA